MKLEPVLAVLNRVETAAAVLQAAASLVRLGEGGPVEVLRPRPDRKPGFMPTEDIMSPGEEAAFEAGEDALTARLERMLREQPVPAALQERRGTVRQMVAQAAAGASIVVVGTPGRAGACTARDAVDAVLFDAGAPLLLMPPGSGSLLLRMVAVAWEESPAAEAALEAAMPLLRQARYITVLVATEGHPQATLPPALQAALRDHGDRAEVRRFPLAGRPIGDAILDEAAACGADLLVMGAFSHHRILETLFGGATREVMAGVDLPLLLHH